MPLRIAVATAQQAAFARAGFDITINPIPRPNYFPTLSDPNNTCDLAAFGWGEDYQDADGIYTPFFNGTANFSQLHDPATSLVVATMAALPERDLVAPVNGLLDARILREQAPLIPFAQLRTVTLAGPQVNNTHLSPLLGQFNLTGAFVK